MAQAASRFGGTIAVLSASLLLSACLTAQQQAELTQRMAPSPALRQEMAQRVLATYAEPSMFRFSHTPYRITSASISDWQIGTLEHHGPTREFYCVFLSGESWTQKGAVYVIVSDEGKTRHVKNVMFMDDEDYVSCGSRGAHVFPELVGRTLTPG